MFTRQQSLKVESAANLVLLKTSLKVLRWRTPVSFMMLAIWQVMRR